MKVRSLHALKTKIIIFLMIISLIFPSGIINPTSAHAVEPATVISIIAAATVGAVYNIMSYVQETKNPNAEGICDAAVTGAFKGIAVATLLLLAKLAVLHGTPLVANYAVTHFNISLSTITPLLSKFITFINGPTMTAAGEITGDYFTILDFLHSDDTEVKNGFWGIVHHYEQQFSEHFQCIGTIACLSLLPSSTGTSLQLKCINFVQKIYNDYMSYGNTAMQYGSLLVKNEIDNFISNFQIDNDSDIYTDKYFGLILAASLITTKIDENGYNVINNFAIEDTIAVGFDVQWDKLHPKMEELSGGQTYPVAIEIKMQSGQQTVLFDTLTGSVGPNTGFNSSWRVLSAYELLKMVGLSPSQGGSASFTGRVSLRSLDGSREIAFYETKPTTVNIDAEQTTIQVQPSSLTFSTQEGGSNPASQTVMISALSGSTDYTWNVSESISWLSIDKTSGFTGSNLLISVNSSALQAGNYNAVLAINCPDLAESRLINISLVVTEQPVPPGSASGDAYVGNGNTSNHGDEAQLHVGGMPTGQTGFYTPTESFIKFEIPVSGKTVTDARLKLYCSAVGDSGTINIKGVIGAWDEYAITLDNRPIQVFELASASVSSTGWKSFNVTDIVNEWSTGRRTNHGFRVMAANNADTFVTFSSRETSNEPLLEITYFNDTQISNLIAASPRPDASTFHVGQTVNWEARITNGGPGDAGSTRTGFWLTESPAPTNTAPIDDEGTGILVVGDGDTADLSYTFSEADMGSGKYLVAKADWERELNESNEDDNVSYYGPFRVYPRADFALTALPDILEVASGSSGLISISAIPTEGNSPSVGLSFPNLPIGMTASFTPSVLSEANGWSSSLKLNVASSVETGLYQFDISATDGTNIHTTTISADVSKFIDSDADGISDAVDNCPDVPNTDQADTDGDSMGDACDACPTDSYNDKDGDGLCADVDNCPITFNPDQADADNDGIGDACEETSDQINSSMASIIAMLLDDKDNNNYIYISDFDNKLISKTNRSGDIIQNIGIGTLQNPRGISIDTKNNIIIADMNDGFRIFDKNGMYIKTIGKNHIDDGSMKYAVESAIDSFGNIYLAGYCAGFIHVYDKDYNYLKSYDYRSDLGYTSSNNSYEGPTGIAYDKIKNRLVMTTHWSSSGDTAQYELDLNGNIIKTFGDSWYSMYAPRVGPDGTLTIIDSTSGVEGVRIFDSEKNQTQIWLQGLPIERDLSFDQSGNIWVIDDTKTINVYSSSNYELINSFTNSDFGRIFNIKTTN